MIKVYEQFIKLVTLYLDVIYNYYQSKNIKFKKCLLCTILCFLFTQ